MSKFILLYKYPPKTQKLYICLCIYKLGRLFSAYFLPYGKTTQEDKKFEDICGNPSDVKKVL